MERILQTTFEDFPQVEVMRDPSYFLALISNLKVYCHFALSTQAIHRRFAVFSWVVASSDVKQHSY